MSTQPMTQPMSTTTRGSADSRLRAQPAKRQFIHHDISSLDTTALNQRFAGSYDALVTAQTAHLKATHPGEDNTARLHCWKLQYPAHFTSDRAEAHAKEMVRLLPSQFTMELHGAMVSVRPSNKKPPRAPRPTPLKQLKVATAADNRMVHNIPVFMHKPQPEEDDIDRAVAKYDTLEDAASAATALSDFDRWVADRRDKFGGNKQSKYGWTAPPSSPTLPTLPPPLMGQPFFSLSFSSVSASPSSVSASPTSLSPSSVPPPMPSPRLSPLSQHMSHLHLAATPTVATAALPSAALSSASSMTDH